MIKAQQFISKLKSILEKDESVLALVLVGSQARFDIYQAGKYSDLEAYIVVNDKDFKAFDSKLPNLAKELGKMLFSFKQDIGFVAVFDDLFRIELPVVKQSDIASVFNRPKAQTVKVLIDKTSGQLKKILNNRPKSSDFPKIFEDIVTNFWYWQIIGAQYFKSGEIYNARRILNIHAAALIKLFEILNDPNIVNLETGKRVEQFLTEDQLKLLKEITVGYDPMEIKHALLKVMDIFSEIVNQLKNKYGWSSDNNIKEKTKLKLIKICYNLLK